MLCLCVLFFFFFKQKTAYEMRISDWSSDVCSSDLLRRVLRHRQGVLGAFQVGAQHLDRALFAVLGDVGLHGRHPVAEEDVDVAVLQAGVGHRDGERSEEHTSELQSLMRISYAVFCLKKKTIPQRYNLEICNINR